ncbi:Ger(x)C family spore germination protein [Clostridium sp. JN-1]|uniref:Ger(x)C family spore germination protein n=1 Tax=Clostridium sp. JN-1 TaxID=2483110 RepID=UPI001FAABE40|nr:Ger(x)C family spore germination protein [Clostridium sp. JN-1]
MNKFLKMISLLLIMITLTGCWDKVEINQKSFVSVIGIDAGEDIGKEKELKKLKSNEPFTGMNLKRIHVTFGLPDISKLGPEKGGAAQDVYINSDAYSMQDAINKANTKTSREITFSHMKLLILGSNLLTYPETFKEIVDYLQRQPALDRTMYLAIAQGKAEDYLKYKPTSEKSFENYILGLMESNQRNNTFVVITLNDFLKLLNQNSNSILPSMKMDNDKKELKISGSGIIKDYKLKGFLTNSQTSDLKILRGEFQGGTKVIYREGHPVDITIDGSDRKIKVRSADNKLIFDIDVNLEGQIKNYYAGNQLFSEDVISSIEEDFNTSIRKECEQSVKITQQQSEVDPIGLREHVEKYHPALWKQNKDNWSEAYKNAQINVNINTKVRRIGAIK